MSTDETPEKTVTYWYHPESDSVYMVNLENEQECYDHASIGQLSVEIDEDQYVKKLIEAIDQDPEHKLPEGISGVIKLGYTWPGKRISGMLWYDRYKRFPDDYPINTSDIVSKEPGGIYCTKNNRYLVEIIQPLKDVQATHI